MASGAANPLIREIVFSDVNVSFLPHPVTGKLPVLKNADAVKAAVRNLILTNFGERPYQPLYGGNITALLFENADDPLLADQIKRQIRSAIRNHEKRAKVTDIEVRSSGDRDQRSISTIDQNLLSITISFLVSNERFPVQLEVAIERAR